MKVQTHTSDSFAPTSFAFSKATPMKCGLTSMHLAGMELRDEWDRIDTKLKKLSAKYDPLKDAVSETTDDVWDSLKLPGGEVAEGFKRIRASIKNPPD